LLGRACSALRDDPSGSQILYFMEKKMAIVRSIDWIAEGGRVHPTEVDCEVRAIGDDGQTYLQISSFGSDARQREKKVSQTLQFSREAALELAAHIERVFGTPHS
jgi:hypothetical protein